MKKYEFFDGFTFKAETKREACEILWKSQKFAFHETLDEYIRSNAYVFGSFSGVVIRDDTPENHIDDLVKTKFLRVIE